MLHDDAEHLDTEAPVSPIPAEGGLLTELQAVLERRLTDVSVQAAARALRTSSRTLQRRLRRAGTSFQAELIAARVRAGKAKMEGSDDKLTIIALEIGCASPQHFSTLFRKHTGMTPSAWRRSQAGMAP